MKKFLLTLTTTLIFFLSVSAQDVNYKSTTIANLDDKTANFTNFSLKDLSIDSKINWLLNLEIEETNLLNPTLINENEKGWVLQYEFKSDSYTGLYKEYLSIVDNKLVISEARNAMMAIGTNCDKLMFTNDDDKCSCVSKIDDNLDSIITFRLFSSLN